MDMKILKAKQEPSTLEDRTDRYKHRSYLFQGRRLTAFEIAADIGHPPKSVHKVLLNGGLKDGEDATLALQFKSRKRAITEADIVPTSDSGPGQMLRTKLYWRMLPMFDKLLTDSSAAASVLEKKFGLSKTGGKDAYAVLKRLVKGISGIDDSLADIDEHKVFKELCKVYPFFSEVSVGVLKMLQTNEQILTSDILEKMILKYGANNRLKDSVRHTLETLVELKMIKKISVSNRNSAWLSMD